MMLDLMLRNRRTWIRGLMDSWSHYPLEVVNSVEWSLRLRGGTSRKRHQSLNRLCPFKNFKGFVVCLFFTHNIHNTAFHVCSVFSSLSGFSLRSWMRTPAVRPSAFHVRGGSWFLPKRPHTHTVTPACSHVSPFWSVCEDDGLMSGVFYFSLFSVGEN